MDVSCFFSFFEPSSLPNIFPSRCFFFSIRNFSDCGLLLTVLGGLCTRSKCGWISFITKSNAASIFSPFASLFVYVKQSRAVILFFLSFDLYAVTSPSVHAGARRTTAPLATTNPTSFNLLAFSFFSFLILSLSSCRRSSNPYIKRFQVDRKSVV